MIDWMLYLSDKLRCSKNIAIMGVGSVLRSDDGVGMFVVELLSKKVIHDDILLLAGSTAPENFTGVIKEFNPDLLIVIDAAQMGLPVGEIKIIDPAEIEGMTFSTHMLPLNIMFQYLNLEISCEIVCIGIQPDNTDQGFEICQQVQDSAQVLAKNLCDWLKRE